MTAKVSPPVSQETPTLSCLELRMWCASLLAFCCHKSGDIQAATADEVAGTVVLMWQGSTYLVRLTVTATKEQHQ